MDKLVRTAVLAALLINRVATAETVGLAKFSISSANAPVDLPQAHGIRLAGRAPVGHRQPQARDVPSENAGNLGHLSEEDRTVDRKLIICRSC